MTAHDVACKVREEGFWKIAWRGGLVIFMLSAVGWLWSLAQIVNTAEAHTGNDSVHHNYRQLQRDFATNDALNSKVDSFEERMNERFRSMEKQLNQIYDRQTEMYRLIRDE